MAQLAFFAVVVVLVAVRGSLASGTGYSCPSPFGYYGDANDCTKFFRCSWGEAYSFDCPYGTRWNQAVLTCDHAYNVPCHGYGGAGASHGSSGSQYSSHSHHSHHSHSASHDDYGSSTGYGSYGYDLPSNYDNYGYSSYGNDYSGYGSPSYSSSYSTGNGYGNGYYKK